MTPTSPSLSRSKKRGDSTIRLLCTLPIRYASSLQPRLVIKLISSRCQWQTSQLQTTIWLEPKALKVQKGKIEEAYRQIFPKVDPYLVSDLYLRIQQDPTYKDDGPFYTVEVFTKEGTDSEASKRHILNTTGTTPAIHDKGTHYVTHMRLTPEILKKLNDFEYVLEVTGDYNGTDASIGATHELGDWRKRYQDDGRSKDMS